jgi:two-component system, chemotaxis family, chemotaxis protein CheY
MTGDNVVDTGVPDDLTIEATDSTAPVEMVEAGQQNKLKPGLIGIGDTRQEKVLLVDDSATTRRIIKSLLVKLGYTDIVEAVDGGEGYQTLGTAEFDLVISDWTMLPVSGLELVSKIRATEAVKDMPFIMVSTASSVEEVVQAKAAGVDAYIVKPFDAKSLRDKIATATQKLAK